MVNSFEFYLNLEMTNLMESRNGQFTQILKWPINSVLKLPIFSNPEVANLEMANSFESKGITTDRVPQQCADRKVF